MLIRQERTPARAPLPYECGLDERRVDSRESCGIAAPAVSGKMLGHIE